MTRGVFSAELEKVLGRDDKVRFVKLLKDNPSEITNSLLVKCPEFGAKKCLLGLLEAPVPPQLDLQTAKALSYVTHWLPDPRIVELMLNHCNAIPFVNVSSTIAFVHGYPIHFALVHLSYLDHLYRWARGHSLLNLIFLLCQWRTKPILDCVRLLALYTDSINDIAWTFVKLRALKQFGALLLVAREKVMTPFDTGLTIREYIAREINSVSECDSDNDSEHAVIAEYTNALIDAGTLVDVFDRTGDSLCSYCSSMLKFVSPEDAIGDVCKLLRKAQVNVGVHDFGVPSSTGRRSLVKISRKYKFAGSDYNGFNPTPARTDRYNLGICTTSSGPVCLPIPKCVPFASQRMGLSTTAGTVKHVKRISKSWEHAHADRLLKHLAYITTTLKKGLRFL